MMEFQLLCAKVTVFNEGTKATGVVYVPITEAIVTEEVLSKAEDVGSSIAMRVEFCQLLFELTESDTPIRDEIVGDRLLLPSGILQRWVNEEPLEEVCFPGGVILTKDQLEEISSPEAQAVLSLMEEQGVDTAIKSIDGLFHPKTPDYDISSAAVVA